MSHPIPTLRPASPLPLPKPKPKVIENYLTAFDTQLKTTQFYLSWFNVFSGSVSFLLSMPLSLCIKLFISQNIFSWIELKIGQGNME